MVLRILFHVFVYFSFFYFSFLPSSSSSVNFCLLWWIWNRSLPYLTVETALILLILSNHIKLCMTVCATFAFKICFWLTPPMSNVSNRRLLVNAIFIIHTPYIIRNCIRPTKISNKRYTHITHSSNILLKTSWQTTN